MIPLFRLQLDGTPTRRLVGAADHDRDATGVCHLDVRAKQRRIARRQQQRADPRLSDSRAEVDDGARLGTPTVQECRSVANGGDVGIGEKDRLAHAIRASITL